jgi:hypothetical protein
MCPFSSYQFIKKVLKLFALLCNFVKQQNTEIMVDETLIIFCEYSTLALPITVYLASAVLSNHIDFAVRHWEFGCVYLPRGEIHHFRFAAPPSPPPFFLKEHPLPCTFDKFFRKKRIH